MPLLGQELILQTLGAVLLIVENVTLKSPLYGLIALPIKLTALPIKQSS